MYIVEGNIGAGKSTFLKLINNYLPEISVVFEPINNWQNQIGGQSLLSNFYQDPQRWAYTMETLAMSCRVQEHLKEQTNPNPLRLIERSIYSGHYCFSLNGYKTGAMTQTEWYVYLELFNFLIPNKCKPPKGFIYLKVSPQIAYERAKKRNRSSELSMPFSYLQEIDECHDNFLIHKNNILPELKQVPVLVLDCNEDFEENHEQLVKHAQEIQKFINQTL
jgi:deoxyadenosine/deoxycytidine kinase